MFYGQTPKTEGHPSGLIYLLPLIVIYYFVMYNITVFLQYKRGAEMKEKIMAKVEKMPVEEKYELLSETDQAYIRGYIDRSAAEQLKTNSRKTKAKPKPQKRSKDQ